MLLDLFDPPLDTLRTLKGKNLGVIPYLPVNMSTFRASLIATLTLLLNMEGHCESVIASSR